MSLNYNDSKARPFSADVTKFSKVRLQSSNCPTIVKHEVTSPVDNLQSFGSPADKTLLDRPRTANQSTQMKFAFLQSMRPVSSPMSNMSMRPLSGIMNSTINFDFVNQIGKASSGKFQDRSNIKPVKRLNTSQFHNIIYKVKHQKELLEKDINRMEQWQKDFKENDIWSTPQNAIIDSILKMNAKSNPDGSVSRYLQNEKEKEETLRSSRKFLQQQRPSSSFVHRSGSRNPKSVKDFFGGDENDQNVIHEIISSKAQSTDYENNKKRITDKINAFVENYGSNNALKPINRDIRSAGQLGSNPREAAKQWRPYEETASGLPQLGDENIVKSISEIVESNEGSDASPSHLKPAQDQTFNKTTQGFDVGNRDKGRPVSAINTAFSPKNFTNSLLRNTSSPQGSLVIHSRPHTAKQMRLTSPGSAIASALAANGEVRQPSVTGVKYIPFRLEGQKVSIGAENLDMNRFNEAVISAKSLSVHQFNASTKASSSTKSMRGLWPGANGFKFTPSRDITSAKGRAGQHRLMSAKAENRPNTANQNTAQEFGLTVGRVNIDGQYLSNFTSNNALVN